VDRDRALWLVLACPLVAIHLVSGAHNDALMVGLVVAGLRVVRDRPGRALPLFAGGALLGLAVSVKVTAVVVVPFAMLAALPGAYRVRALARHGGLVLAGTVAAAVLVTGLAGLGPGWVRGLASSGESVQWTSLPTAVGLALGYLGRPFGADWYVVPAARAVGLGVLALLLVAIWWRARHGSPLRGAGLALGPAGRDEPGQVHEVPRNPGDGGGVGRSRGGGRPPAGRASASTGRAARRRFPSLT